MTMRFALTGFVTSLVNFALHALGYFLFLKEFFAQHPASTPEFQSQLVKSPDQMVSWALALSALAFGYLVTTVVQWSGAKDLGSGLRTGAIAGALLWTGFNFGLYGSANNFSLAGTIVDTFCSALCVTLSSGFAAWLLHRKHGPREATTHGGTTTKALRAT